MKSYIRIIFNVTITFLILFIPMHNLHFYHRCTQPIFLFKMVFVVVSLSYAYILSDSVKLLSFRFTSIVIPLGKNKQFCLWNCVCLGFFIIFHSVVIGGLSAHDFNAYQITTNFFLLYRCRWPFGVLHSW